MYTHTASIGVITCSLIHFLHTFTDWSVPISSAALHTIPTFGNSVTSASTSLTNLISTPIPSVHPTSAASPFYPQELPSKLVRKILDLEFVEMAELVPDSWRSEEVDYQCCSSHNPRIPKRGPVMNILLWVECYSSLVAVLSSKYPNKTGHFMAYQKTIIKAHRSFVGEGWVVYDTCFRRKAANMKNLDWGEVDLTLYNETFVGRAKVLHRCTLCLSELHTTSECSLSSAPYPTTATRSGTSSGWRTGERKTVPICLLYNDRYGDNCTYAPNCKFGHTCSAYQGRHPYSKCPNRRSYPYTSRNPSDTPRQRRK